MPSLPVLPASPLRSQREQPRKTVRTFERGAILAFEVGKLAGDIVGRQALSDRRARGGCVRRIRIQVQEAYEQPMSVHGRMPIVAAIERRREQVRRTRIGIAVKGVREVVRVLLV